MSSYLIHTGPAQITSEDICAELCISGQYIELLVKTVAIVPICLLQHARSETWAVTVGARFDEEIVWAGGRRPVSIGEAYDRNGVVVRDCIYEPSAERLEKARAAILAKCMRIDDPAMIEALAVGETARKAKAYTVLTQQLHHSLDKVA